MTDLPAARPLRVVIGEGVRRLREAADIRQEDVARVAQAHGLTWSRSKVAALERGDKPVSLEEFALLPRILAEATGSMVSSGALIPSGALIRLTDRITAPGETLKSVYGGQWVRPTRSAGVFPDGSADDIVTDPEELQRIAAAMVDGIGAAEDKAADKLGTTPMAIAVAAQSLWGRSLTAERDRIVTEREPDAVPDRRRALRGQVTRQLTEQLASELARRESTG